MLGPRFRGDDEKGAPAVDAPRTKIIEAHGYRIIRFWNNEVFENLDGVLATIDQQLAIHR